MVQIAVEFEQWKLELFKAAAPGEFYFCERVSAPGTVCRMCPFTLALFDVQDFDAFHPVNLYWPDECTMMFGSGFKSMQ